MHKTIRFEVYLDYRLLEATCYGLDGPEIESRWGEFFRTRPDRPSGPRSLLYNRHRFYFQGLKLPERGVDHPPLSSTEVKETVELYCISSGPSWPVLGRTLRRARVMMLLLRNFV